ncbi:Saccharopine dehydrogenase-domain-containing protein [Mycena floridula]|nr:Saccharopine dehydrogenase-domain-containing protein [Mycena floridula]
MSFLKVSLRIRSRIRPLSQLVVGIRREDPTRLWERRSPLTPEVVDKLVSSDNGVQVHVESCDRRVFSDDEYIKAGAIIQPNLEKAHIILGIKEPPLQSLLPSPVDGLARTYMMFSHTAKGQAYNLPLLKSFLSSDTSPTLVDFELLTSSVDGKRTVGFGWFAGVAGVLESLSAMAHSHLEIGVASPFIYTPRPQTLPSLDQLRAALRSIGTRIASEGTPKKLGPFIIGLTGTGNVAEGCLSILQELPIVKVAVADLSKLIADPDTDRTKIYLVHALPSDYFVRTDSPAAPYNRDHYYANPHLYESIFCENIAPYLTLFLNGAGWAPSYPRLMTNDQLPVALARARELGGARFTNIGDISCDPEGGLEFLTHSTTLSNPFDKYRPASLTPDLPSVQMMAVDILPTSIPWDASQAFSEALWPYLNALIDRYRQNANEYQAALDRATIATKGQLTEKHAWLGGLLNDSTPLAIEPVQQSRGILKRKRILMLGSGMVAGPAVDKIAGRNDVQLVVAGNSLVELQKLTSKHAEHIQYKKVDMNDRTAVSQLIQESDVVISLLPVAFHPTVAELCIKHRKHLVTASYISPAMRALHQQALDTDVLLLNEIGLDPGIDRCSAISLISDVCSSSEWYPTSFISFCGGLPAPENKGPLGYKFSWSPRGVLTAALNDARFKLRGNIFKVPGKDLLKSVFRDVPVVEGMSFEGLPNRDSLPYAEEYDLHPVEELNTVLRGTLRYPGFSELMQSFKDLGLLETEHLLKDVRTWDDLVPQSQELAKSLNANGDHSNMTSTSHAALKWLLDSNSLPLLPAEPLPPLDMFATLLAFRLKYEPQERDMVVLAHEVVGDSKRSRRKNVWTSTMVVYGFPDGHSAMARTVGLPVAIAALNVIDSPPRVRGVCGPKDPSIWAPVLEGLRQEGLVMEERMTGAIDTSIQSRL